MHPVLTDKQTIIFRYIQKYQQANGYSPTRAEIAENFAMCANAANDHLRLIEKKGFIRIAPKVARGIVITKMEKGFVK